MPKDTKLHDALHTQLGKEQYCPECGGNNPSGLRLPDQCVWCNGLKSLPKIDLSKGWNGRGEQKTTKEEYQKISKDIMNTTPNEMIGKIKGEINMENTVITIFDDGEGNYVLWDTKTGSVRTKDGIWLNPDPNSDTQT